MTVVRPVEDASGTEPDDRPPPSAFRWPRPWVGVALVAVLWSLVFAVLGVLRYWSFLTYAWDLGIYNQAISTTVFSHRFFYYTADIPAGTHGNLFAVHFSPFLLLILPFYAAVPSPGTLLVLQAFGVGLAALPLYGIAAARLGSSRWGMLIAGAYLLSPATQGLTWYDFHPESFLPLTVLTSLYFLQKGRSWPFFLSWLLTLSVVEEIAPFLALFALLTLLPVLAARWKGAPVRTPVPVIWLVAALAVALAWIGIAYVALLGAGAPGGGAFGSAYGVNWSVLGAASPAGVFPQALLHPGLALQALTYEASAKLLYVALLFGPLAFLSWAGEDRYLLPVLGWLALALLSNWDAYYSVGDQYPAYVLAFIFVGAIGGLLWARRTLPQLTAAFRRWHPRPRPADLGEGRWKARARALLRAERPLGAAVVACALGCALVASPLLAAPAGGYDEITYGIPTVSAHDTLVHRLISMIPSGAGVLTTSTLFPEVSGDLHAFVLPTSSYFVGNSTFAGAVDSDVNQSQYVLLDYTTDPYSAVILAATADLEGFGLLAEADGAYLYERGFQQPPSWYVPWSSVNVAPSSLVPGDAVIEPGLSGSPLVHAPGMINGSELWSGLDLSPVPPGSYELTLELRVMGNPATPGLLATLVRTPIGVTLAMVNPSPAGHDYGFVESAPPSESQDVNTTPIVPGPGAGWENVTLEANWTSASLLECQGWLESPADAIWLYGITVQQTGVP